MAKLSVIDYYDLRDTILKMKLLICKNWVEFVWLLLLKGRNCVHGIS